MPMIDTNGLPLLRPAWKGKPSLSRSAIRALVRAYRRERHNICPTPGIHAAAQDELLNALKRRGLITDEPVPILTDAGAAVAQDFIATSE